MGLKGLAVAGLVVAGLVVLVFGAVRIQTSQAVVQPGPMGAMLTLQSNSTGVSQQLSGNVSTLLNTTTATADAGMGNTATLLKGLHTPVQSFFDTTLTSAAQSRTVDAQQMNAIYSCGGK